MTCLVRSGICISACVAIMGFGALVRADEKAECLASYDRAQDMLKEGKLRAARDVFARCAAAACPARLRDECTKENVGLGETIPTIVVGARDEQGHDTAEVRVFVDGELVVERLDGKPMELDPGPHTLRFVSSSGAIVELPIVTRTGERNRVVTADFKRTAAPPPVPQPMRSAAPQAPAYEPNPWPVSSYVLGSIGIVGLGAFVGFGLSGMSRKADLDKCEPACSPDQIDAVRWRYRAADISLGVGVISIGTAVVLVATRGTRPVKQHATVDVIPTQNGAVLSLGAAF